MHMDQVFACALALSYVILLWVANQPCSASELIVLWQITIRHSPPQLMPTRLHPHICDAVCTECGAWLAWLGRTSYLPTTVEIHVNVNAVCEQCGLPFHLRSSSSSFDAQAALGLKRTRGMANEFGRKRRPHLC